MRLDRRGRISKGDAENNQKDKEISEVCDVLEIQGNKIYQKNRELSTLSNDVD